MRDIFSKKMINKKSFQIQNTSDLSVIIKPFNAMSREQIKEEVGALLQDAKEKLPLLRNELVDLIKEANPINLLTVFAISSLSTIDEGKGVSIQDSKIEIPQCYIEYIQALFLTLPDNECNTEARITDEYFNKIKNILDYIFLTSVLTRFDGETELVTDEEKSAFLMRSLIQMQTKSVRNWGYYAQVKGVALELYSHFNVGLKKHSGFSVDNVICFFDFLIDSVELKINERISKLQEYYKLDIESLRKAVLDETNEGEFLELMKCETHDANKETLIYFLLVRLMYCDESLFVFNNSEISSGTSIPIDEVESIKIIFLLRKDRWKK